MILVEADVAGAEWVIVAHLAQDPRMLDIIRTGKRPHVVTGSLLCGVPEESVVAEREATKDASTPEEYLAGRKQVETLNGASFLPRRMSIYDCAKRANYGLNYGLGPQKFALVNEMEVSEAKTVKKAYLDAYPGIKEHFWAETEREVAKPPFMVSNLFGDKRRFLGPKDQETFNAAYSYKPQSTVATMLRRAKVKAYNSDVLARCALLMQVHDSLVMQMPDEDLPALAGCISALQGYMDPEIPSPSGPFHLKTGVKLGYDWGHMVELSDQWDAEELRRVRETAKEYHRVLP